MSKICIASNHFIEVKKIQKTLLNLNSESNVNDVKVTKLSHLTQTLRPDLDLLVYSHPQHLFVNMRQSLIDWYKQGFLGAVIILADSEQMESLENIAVHFHNVWVFEKPFSPEPLLELSAEALACVEKKKRRFKRFSSEQGLSLESYKTSYKAQSTLFNISLGGSCIEGQLSELRLGDIIKMYFVFDELGRERSVSGKVVWLKDRKGEQAGIEFLKEEDVYKELLNFDKKIS